jgi:hypothetical protein
MHPECPAARPRTALDQHASVLGSITIDGVGPAASGGLHVSVLGSITIGGVEDGAAAFTGSFSLCCTPSSSGVLEQALPLQSHHVDRIECNKPFPLISVVEHTFAVFAAPSSRIIIGTESPSNNEQLAEGIRYITAGCTGYSCLKPWNVKMQAEYWRVAEGPEIVFTPIQPWARWKSHLRTDPFPITALAIPTWIESAKGKEANHFIQYAFQANWPKQAEVALFIWRGTPNETVLEIAYIFQLLKPTPDAVWSS